MIIYRLISFVRVWSAIAFSNEMTAMGKVQSALASSQIDCDEARHWFWFHAWASHCNSPWFDKEQWWGDRA